MKKVLFMLAAAASLGLFAGDSLLLWQFSDFTVVEDQGEEVVVETLIADVNGGEAKPLRDIVGRGEAEGKRVNGVRVKMVGAGDDPYLNFYAAVDTGSGYVPGSAGASVMNLPASFTYGGQSYDVWDAGPAFAMIGDVSDLPASVSFMIEFGNYDSETGDWFVLAASEQGMLGDLTRDGHIFNGELDMQSVVPWSGGQYSVPEPTSGILLLVGAGLLALRRGKIRN